VATSRKYRPRGYKSGGAVIPENADVPSLENPPEVASTPETIAVPPPAVADGGTVSTPGADDAVVRALQATRHAEDLQRQAAQRAQQPQTVEQYIDERFANLSLHKRQFLKANPMMLDDAIVPIAAQAYRAAIAEGVPDDSDEMNARLLDGVRQEIEGRRQRMVASAHDAAAAVPAKPEPSIEKAVEKLNREVEGHRMTMSAEENTPLTVTAELPPAERAPSRKSLPVSAPVSREVPTASGARASSERTVTLSAEERVLAHSSYSWMPKDAAEREYATHKLRLKKLRESGEYSG
jgi:hypothetical protein